MLFLGGGLYLGLVSTVAGGGGSSQSGYVDGVGSMSRLFYPYALSVTSVGDIIVADSYNHIIRRIVSSGAFCSLLSSLSFFLLCHLTLSSFFHIPWSHLFVKEKLMKFVLLYFWA